MNHLQSTIHFIHRYKPRKDFKHLVLNRIYKFAKDDKMPIREFSEVLTVLLKSVK
ncbi:MAG: hypothetical protein ACHQF4_02440 [Sphingobacteriales bacterium]